MHGAKNSFIPIFLLLISCSRNQESALRMQVDTIGFAQYSWQMDSVMSRITHSRLHPGNAPVCYDTAWFQASREKAPDTALGVICPHDDYSYAGPLYESVLSTIRAPFVILIGVAHKARAMGIENRIVFGSPVSWKAPYGEVKISPLQKKLLEKLDTSCYLISDSLMNAEHSLEALVPFLQYYHRDLVILPLLVTAMNIERTEKITASLSDAISTLLQEEGLKWGTGYSIVISSDAVHYGDEGWGGKNFAAFDTGTEGYAKAFEKENYLLDSCLSGTIKPSKIRDFAAITVQQTDFREYAWTWCGRYSVPFGLSFIHELSEKQNIVVQGRSIGYLSSLDHDRIPVEDLGMGLTAPASLHHWVGYPGVVYSLK
jgi:AmmeMemoRadiSam system protein B